MPANSNSVQFFAKCISEKKFKLRSKKERDDHIHACIEIYKNKEASDSLKEAMLSEIIYNVWYLYPYILGSKRFPERLFDESVQNMAIHTIKAVDRFNPSIGRKFTSYLAGYMLDAISTSAIEDSVVRPPTTISKSSVIKMASTSQAKNDIAEDDMKEDNPQMPVRIMNEDSLRGHRSDHNIEDDYCIKEMLDIVEEAISQDGLLDEKEKMVIACRYGVFGSPKITLQQVAKLFHARGWRASKSWIYQLEQRAIKKIRNYLSDCNIDI